MNPWLRWSLIVVFSPIWLPLFSLALLGFGAVIFFAAVADIAGAALDNKPIDWKSVRSVL